MNERGLLAQIINSMRNNQQQGAFGNVTDNEMSMFSGNPMNGAVAGAVAGGAVGNVSNNEAAMFNMMADYRANNPMPRINEMRNNLATAGSVGNASNREADMINRLNEIKEMGQKGILTDSLKQEAMFIQKMLPPVEVMPPDIDNLKLSPEELRKLLEVVESPNFRGFPMRGGR